MLSLKACYSQAFSFVCLFARGSLLCPYKFWLLLLYLWGMQACGGIHTPIWRKVGGPQSLHGVASLLAAARLLPKRCLDTGSATMLSWGSKLSFVEAQRRLEPSWWWTSSSWCKVKLRKMGEAFCLAEFYFCYGTFLRRVLGNELRVLYWLCFVGSGCAFLYGFTYENQGVLFFAVFGTLGPLFPGPVLLLSSSSFFPLSSLGVGLGFFSSLLFFAPGLQDCRGWRRQVRRCTWHSCCSPFLLSLSARAGSPLPPSLLSLSLSLSSLSLSCMQEWNTSQSVLPLRCSGLHECHTTTFSESKL